MTCALASESETSQALDRLQFRSFFGSFPIGTSVAVRPQMPLVFTYPG